VVTSCLVFEGQGRVREYVGGYSDWLRRRVVEPPTPRPPRPRAEVRTPRPRAPGRLGYSEQRELEQLPARIEQLEAEQGDLQALTSRPEFYRRDPAAVQQMLGRLKALEQELERAYRRWAELEAQRSG